MNSKRSLKEQADTLGLDLDSPATVTLGFADDAYEINFSIASSLADGLSAEQLALVREQLGEPDDSDEELRRKLVQLINFLANYFGDLTDDAETDEESVVTWNLEGDDLEDPAFFATALLNRLDLLSPMGFAAVGL